MNPRNVGEIENPDGVGQVGNARCGDIMKVFLRIEDNVIVDVKFKTFGLSLIHIYQFRGHTACCYGGAAAKSLKLYIGNYVIFYFQIYLHNIAAF